MFSSSPFFWTFLRFVSGFCNFLSFYPCDKKEIFEKLTEFFTSEFFREIYFGQHSRIVRLLLCYHLFLFNETKPFLSMQIL